MRQRYDRLTQAPAEFFGEHVHHGYWIEARDILAAQRALIAKLADFAGVARAARVLDVGCATGGSARWLAQNLDCSVLGISISEKEIAAATNKARVAGLADRLEFRVMDATQLAPDIRDASRARGNRFFGQIRTEGIRKLA
ncbi:MAG: methyltransferase domain-containing protein [Chthoniobacterales bacterium]